MNHVQIATYISDITHAERKKECERERNNARINIVNGFVSTVYNVAYIYSTNDFCQLNKVNSCWLSDFEIDDMQF